MLLAQLVRLVQFLQGGGEDKVKHKICTLSLHYKN
jgi:hypothetical protein